MKTKLILILLLVMLGLPSASSAQVDVTPIPYERAEYSFFPDTIAGIPISVQYDVASRQWTLTVAGGIDNEELNQHYPHRDVVIDGNSAMQIMYDRSIVRVEIILVSEDTKMVTLIRE